MMITVCTYPVPRPFISTISFPQLNACIRQKGILHILSFKFGFILHSHNIGIFTHLCFKGSYLIVLKTCLVKDVK